MPRQKLDNPERAATVLREILLLGKKRTYGEPLSVEDVGKIPPPTLRALVENRDIELIGADHPDRRSDVAALAEKVEELTAKVEELVEKIDRLPMAGSGVAVEPERRARSS